MSDDTDMALMISKVEGRGWQYAVGGDNWRDDDTLEVKVDVSEDDHAEPSSPLYSPATLSDLPDLCIIM